MRILLTGSTGYIGGEVLHQALQSPSITHITTLTRKPLPTGSGDHWDTQKIRSIVHSDFSDYPDSLIAQLKEGGGIDACVWALGVFTNDPRRNQLVNYDYTLAGARALRDAFGPGAHRAFRFVYVSGGAAEQNQEKKLWLMEGSRKLRGKLEKDLTSLRVEGEFETYVARPWYIPNKQEKKGIRDTILLGIHKALGMPYCHVDTLALALLSLAEQGNPEKYGQDGIVEVADLKKLAIVHE